MICPTSRLATIGTKQYTLSNLHLSDAAVAHCPALALQSEQRQPGYDISTYAAVCLLRGRAFEALENRQRAIACYTAALQ
jgi:hypothetical protein